MKKEEWNNFFMGPGKTMYPLSANANVLSAFRFPPNVTFPPPMWCTRGTSRLGGGGQAEETESALALAESGYIDLP